MSLITRNIDDYVNICGYYAVNMVATILDVIGPSMQLYIDGATNRSNTIYSPFC